MRTGEDLPYYPFDSRRLLGTQYVDEFKRPYCFLSTQRHALIYSVGPDGIDDSGEHGDDMGQRVQFVNR